LPRLTKFTRSQKLRRTQLSWNFLIMVKLNFYQFMTYEHLLRETTRLKLFGQSSTLHQHFPLADIFKWGKCLIASQYTRHITDGTHTHLFRIEARYTSNVIKIFPVFGCWWISDSSNVKRNKFRQAIQQQLGMVFDTARVLRSYARLHAHFCHTLCNVESLNCSVECAYHLLVHSYKIIQSIFQHIPCRCTSGLNSYVDAILRWMGNAITTEGYARILVQHKTKWISECMIFVHDRKRRVPRIRVPSELHCDTCRASRRQSANSLVALRSENNSTQFRLHDAGACMS